MRFDFNLHEHGWAYPEVEIDGRTVTMAVGWTCDALGDLLDAHVALLNGGTRARFLWEREPGWWAWDLSRPDEQSVEVRIEFLADDDEGPSLEDPPKIGIEGTVALVELVGAVAAGARRCFEPLGAQRFAAEWDERPFPALQLELLERWLDHPAPVPRYVRPLEDDEDDEDFEEADEADEVGFEQCALEERRNGFPYWTWLHASSDFHLTRRRRATIELEYEIDDDAAVLSTSGFSGDREQRLSQAVKGLLRPPLLEARGITVLRAHITDEPAALPAPPT